MPELTFGEDGPGLWQIMHNGAAQCQAERFGLPSEATTANVCSYIEGTDGSGDMERNQQIVQVAEARKVFDVRFAIDEEVSGSSSNPNLGGCAFAPTSSIGNAVFHLSRRDDDLWWRDFTSLFSEVE